MSHSNFTLNPRLFQEKEQNKNTDSSSQEIPFIKQEQEEEYVHHPHSVHLGNTPELKYKDGHESGSYPSFSAEKHGIRNHSNHLPDPQEYQYSRGQDLSLAQSGSFRSPEEYDQYIADLASLRKYQTGPSDPFQSSSPQASLQTGGSESFRIYSASTGLQPASSDVNRSSEDFYYHTGDVPQAQPYQYHLTHDQSSAGQSLPIQHFSTQNVVDNQYYSSQAYNSLPASQVPEPALDLDEYPVLQPGLITMNLPTPPTTQEICYLQSWIPRNQLEIEKFYAARPGLSRPILGSSSKQDQLDIVIRQMLVEHGAISDERKDIHDRYDQLGAILIGRFRAKNPEHACELQRYGKFAFSLPAFSSSTITQALPYPYKISSSGIFNHYNQISSNNYEKMGSPDVEAVKKWGGIRKQTNNKGVYHEVLHRRRTMLGAKFHPESKRLMALPHSTGETLSDRDILQLARLSPYQRHLRASNFFNERGEFYTRHIRFTEMPDEYLRREGLLRSWIPRKAGDRPRNSIERAARAAQLGLTGDDKLIADAAAERLRRAASEKNMRESKAA
ncbi:hypothetical protein BOTCAL_0231g00020 [Botryotinia calthae]|uniref:Uncharacterized protein n=1 Tax=Botryotinia calthae TaxID=38488 RepID=A0A4Y8CXJ2_9HELO|nr:hypothetical protein BOTCAL_0231g00020 [Botryotinia calthae]